MASSGLTFGAVAVGGAIGSMARLAVGTAIQQRVGTGFPLGTLVINITGSLLLGFLISIALNTPAVTPAFRAFLTTGVCGGYTTFSAFSYDAVVLIDEGAYGRAALYALASVTLAILGALVGISAGRWVVSLARAR